MSAPFPPKPPSNPLFRRVLRLWWLVLFFPIIWFAVADYLAVRVFGTEHIFQSPLKGVLMGIGPSLLFLFFMIWVMRVTTSTAHVQESSVRETDLRQANRSLRILSQCNQTLVRAQTEEELLTGICRAIVEIGDYRMAWVGYAEGGPDKIIRPAASWGDHTDLIGRTRITWGPDEAGRGPTGRAIRGRAVVTIPDAREDSSPGPWLQNALAAGFASSLAAPLLDERGDAFGALTVHAGQPHAFTAADIEMFRELAADIAYGLRSIRAREENRKLVQAVEQSASGVIITDPGGVFEYVNPAFSKVTGYTLEDLKGKTPRVLKSGKQPPETYERLWTAIRFGNSFQGEFINRRKDGSEYTAGVHISPVLDESGAITHFVGVQEDITAFVEAKRQLERHAARLQKLLQLDRDISSSLDLSEVFQHVVDAAAELLEADYAVLFTAEDGELVYRADHGGWAEARETPESHPLGGAYLVYRTGEPSRVEDTSRDPVWSTIPWAAAQGIKSYLGVPLKREGKTAGVLGTLYRGARKFTDQEVELLSLLANHAAVEIEKARLHRDAEEKRDSLQSILDASGDPIIVVDPAGNITYWSPAAVALFGFSPEEIIGKNTRDTIIPESESAQRDEMVAKAMQGERMSYETQRWRKDRTLAPVRVTTSPVREPGGEVVARTVIFRDLTEQRRAEREREAYIERMKALNGLIARISASPGVEEVFGHVTSAAAELLGADYAFISILEGGKLVFRAGHGGWREEGEDLQVPPGGASMTVFETGKPLYIEDITRSPIWKNKARAEARGAKSFLGVPLMQGSATVGTLAIVSRERREFSEQDIGLLSVLANHAAIAIEKARLHEDAREGLEFLRSALDASSNPIHISDAQNRALFWNDAAEKLFGFTKEEISGEKLPNITPEDARADMTGAIAKLLRGERVSYESRRRRKDGTVFPVHISGTPVRDAGGNVVARTVIFEDLTERKRTEREREAHIGRLRELNSLTARISASPGLDEVFRQVVRAGAEFLGADVTVLFTAEGGELAYRADHGGWAEARHSAELSPQGRSYAVFRTGEPLYVAELSRSGEWKSFLGVPLKRGKSVVGVLAALTRAVRRFSEEDLDLLSLLANHAATAIEKARLHEDVQKGLDFLRNILESSGQPIDVIDLEGRILMWNPAAEALFGYPAAEIVGKTGVETIIPEDQREQRDQAVARALRGERMSFETWRRRKDGALVPVRITTSPVRDADGKVAARISIFQDLTEEKRAEREREAYIERLKALNGLIARIAASPGLDVAFRHVVDAAGFFGADYAVLFTAENGNLIYRADHGGWAEGRESTEPHLLGGAYRVYQTGQPFCTEDISSDPLWRSMSWAAAQGIKSYLGVPLKHEGEVAGVLGTMYRAARKFSDQDIELLSLLANHAAIAIEKARLHEDIRKGLEFYRSVITSSVDPILTLDAQNRILSWNEAAEELFGFSAEEAIGKTTDETFLPENERAARDAAVAEVMRGGKNVRETVRRRKDGRLIPVRLTSSPVRDAAGGVVARTAVFQDLTGQKRAEREREAHIGRLKALNGLLSQISASLQVEEVFSFVAQAAVDILNLSLVDLLVQDDQEDLVAKAHIGKLAQAMSMERIPKGQGLAGLVVRRAEPVYIREVAESPEFIRKEEARRLGIGSFLGIPLKVRGEVIGVLNGMTEGARDFTQEEIDLAISLANGAATAIANAQDHARLQDTIEQLQRGQAMLVRAEKLSTIGTLTAGAAHEILNPANIIGLHAQRLMWENAEGSSPHQSAQVILRNVERISRICEDLRRFSRDEAAKRDPFDPDDTLRQCIRPLESELRLASIEVSDKLAGKAPIILGDKNQILQVFFNLLRNAKDAMPQGGTLTVASREAAGDGARWWETRVSDTGTGIPPDTLPRIFDPFFTTKTEDKGTGLGLSVSYGIIESHGGRIWAENNPERGATFFVWLPIKEEEDGQAASAHSGGG